MNHRMLSHSQTTQSPGVFMLGQVQQILSMQRLLGTLVINVIDSAIHFSFNWIATEVHDGTAWRRMLSPAVTPQLSGNGQKKGEKTKDCQ